MPFDLLVILMISSNSCSNATFAIPKMIPQHWHYSPWRASVRSAMHRDWMAYVYKKLYILLNRPVETSDFITFTTKTVLFTITNYINTSKSCKGYVESAKLIHTKHCTELVVLKMAHQHEKLWKSIVTKDTLFFCV